MFYSAFEDLFILWSVHEENVLRFEDLRKGSLSVTEYEARLYQLSHRALTLILDKVEKVHRFIRGMTFFIRYYVFRAAHEGSYFKSVVSTTKAVEFMVREEFGDPERAHTLCQFSSTSSRGRGSRRGGSSSQHHGPVHASLPATESGLVSRGSQSLAEVAMEVHLVQSNLHPYLGLILCVGIQAT